MVKPTDKKKDVTVPVPPLVTPTIEEAPVEPEVEPLPVSVVPNPTNTFECAEWQKDRLKMIAEQRGTSMSEIMRIMMVRWLRRN